MAETGQKSTGYNTDYVIGSNRFADNSYRDYIDGLKNRNIDISQVRIFQVTGGKAIIYNVFYGHYANRKAANKAVAGLPKVLRANSPFGRTVGGIRDEINQ